MLNSFFKTIGFEDGSVDESRALKETAGISDLSEELVYESFDANTNVFGLKSGYFGVIFEVDPIVGITEMLDKNLAYFFGEELPYDTYFQINLIGSQKISNVLDLWHESKTHDTMLKSIKKRRYEFLESKALKFDSVTTPRDYRIFISVTQKCKIENFNKFKTQIFKKFDALVLKPRLCNASTLIEMIADIVQMQKSIASSVKRYNPLDCLGCQCLKSEKMTIGKDHILSDETELVTKVLQVEEYPEEFSLIEMINLLGSGVRDSLAISGRFMICLGVATNISQHKQDSILTAGGNVIQSSEKFYSRHDAGLKKEASEWIDIIEQVKTGSKILNTCFTVVITSTKEEISNLEHAVISLYNMHNWKVRVATNVQLIGLLGMLPMQFYYYFDALKFFKLTSRRLSTEVLGMLPLHAEWRGMPSSGMLLMGRRGQLFNWNPFYRIGGGGNYNVCVFGPSGSGKSVLLQELSITMLSQGVKVFILDIGQSFKNICTILGGEIVKFSHDMDISLNPFGQGNVFDKEILTCIQSIISSMCGANGKAEEAQLEKAILDAMQLYGENVNITSIVEALKSINTVEAIRMSMALFPYTCDGKYGRFFDKVSNITFNKSITVFEFEEIRNDPRLLSVVLQVISMQIFLQVLSGDRQQQFMLIVDEAWMILDYAAKFLSDLARVIRKYGGSLVVCVQNYDDFQRTEEHRTIFQNSTWTVMLKQDEKGLNSFKSSEAFKDMLGLIRSVRFAPPQFAEALIYGTGVQIVARLVLDPFSAKLFSTDAKDFNYISKCAASGVPINEAVEQLIKTNK